MNTAKAELQVKRKNYLLRISPISTVQAVHDLEKSRRNKLMAVFLN